MIRFPLRGSQSHAAAAVVAAWLTIGAATTGLAAVQYGLYGGSMSGAYVTSDLPSAYEVYDGAVMVYDTTDFNNNTTWVYWGQMYFDGGDYTFQKNNWDDGIYLVIDGEVIIDNNTYNAVVSKTVSGKPAGWYDFEIRAGQGTGGVGGNFYYWKGSTVATTEERLRIMNDDPENPVFRCGASFKVTANPKVGTVSPAYGAGMASDGETITFTATGTERYTCVGYELSLTVDGVKTILASGDTSSFDWTYTDECDGAVLEWKWKFTGAQDVYWAAPNGTAEAACTEEDPGTIAAALAKCVARESFAAGDVVMLKSGTYDFTGVACANDRTSALIPINKAFVTIKSETDTPEDCIIRGWGTVVTKTELTDDDGNVTNTVTTTTYNLQRCFSVTGPALIRGIRIENFTAPNNGYFCPVTGIFKVKATDLGVLEAENCVISGLSRSANSSGYIYGAFCDGGIYRDCVISNFTDRACGGFGGGLCNGNARFERCKIQQSNANYSLFNGSSVLVDCVFEGNKQYGNFPCICQDVGLVQNCSFFTNKAMCVRSTSTSDSVVTRVDGCTFVGNSLSGANGIGICAKNRTAVLVTSSRFESNNVSSLIAEGSVCGGVAGWYGAYSNCVFRGNWTSDQRGGGTVRYATLWNCTIEGNYATSGSSCGLMNCTAINCLVKDNDQQNGQPVNYGNRLLNCTVVGSTTTAAAVRGGAATNTIVYGTSSGVDIDTGDYSHVLYGTSSDAGTLTDCAQLAEDPFYGSAKPETPYLPKRKSGAIDGGILLAEVGPADYYGNKRLVGKALDIGCVERQAKGMAVICR